MTSQLFSEEPSLSLPRQWSYQEFRSAKLDYAYITQASEAKRIVHAIEAFEPQAVAIDFETTRSSIRLIQMGFDPPGFRARQLIFDCHRIPAELLLPIMGNPTIEKMIHHSQFEQKWTHSRLGIVMENVFDTCIAWKLIQGALATHISRGPEELIPGWKKHPNKLTTLCEGYLGFALPKEQQTSRWEQENLSVEQLVYAALDVAVLPPLTTYTKQLLQFLQLNIEVDQRARAVAARF
jgi:ribonuclease D